ncbi:SpoIIE family protein phosphatase [Streptomyces sp. NPDC020917]|uniref:SpoIIE family protein phosphatase n=1 Tax=Streptomyces sp. NPDC020917 TaxID=3365102 RepID=UPI00378E235D
MRHSTDTGRQAGFGLDHLEPVLAAAVRDSGASAGLLYLLPPGEQVLWLSLVSGVPKGLAAPWARVSLEAPTPVADAIRQERLVWLAGREEMARRYPRLGVVMPYEFMVAAAPLTGRRQVWGTLVLLWQVWRPPQLSEHERDTITGFCRRASAVLDQAADDGRPVRAPEEPRVLAAERSPADPTQAPAALEFTHRLPLGCCALDLDGRLTLVNPAATALMDAGAATLIGRRPWEVLLWLSGPVFEDRYMAAVLSRQPTSFTAVRPPDTPLLFRLYPGPSGISVVISHAPAHDAAAPADRQDAAPVEQSAGTPLYLLTRLAVALAEAAGVRDVAELAADQIVPAFGPQGMALMTIEGGRERILSSRGYSTEFLSRFDGAPVTEGYPGAHAARNAECLFFPSFADYQRAFPRVLRYGDRNAWAFLPLITSGRPIGALILSYDEPRAFSVPERAVLTSLAGLVAQALGRARLYDSNHELARTLQTGLLPRALPRIPGLETAARYLPAGQAGIGGDFYDVIRGDGLAAAVIGDVQGHNTTAAALMGQVRTAVHAHASTSAPPGEVLARTNRLIADLDPGLFTSCLIAHIDLPRHRVRLASAGHPPPLLRFPDGHTEVVRLPPGLLLGIEPATEYSTTEIPLPPGAVLALYTDGLVEVPGIDIDRTTEDLARRLAHAPARDLEQLADALVPTLEPPATRHDDIALLLIRPQDNGR